MSCKLGEGVGVVAECLIAAAFSSILPPSVGSDTILQRGFWTGAAHTFYHSPGGALW